MKIGKKVYKYSMKESISDNRLIDECIYTDSGASTQFICHAIEHLASRIEECHADYTLYFNSIQFKYNIQH